MFFRIDEAASKGLIGPDVKTQDFNSSIDAFGT